MSMPPTKSSMSFPFASEPGRPTIKLLYPPCLLKKSMRFQFVPPSRVLHNPEYGEVLTLKLICCHIAAIRSLLSAGFMTRSIGGTGVEDFDDPALTISDCLHEMPLSVDFQIPRLVSA